MDQGYFAAGDAKIISYAILTMCTAVANWFKPEGRLSGDQISSIYEELVVTRLLRESLPLYSFENSALEEKNNTAENITIVHKPKKGDVQ